MFTATLYNLENEEKSFAQLLAPEKVNLVLFYNTNCLGCTGRAIPYAYELSQKFTSLNLVVVHVSFGGKVESKDEINEVFTAGKAPFPIYRDDNATLFHAFHCEGTPHWIICNANGEVKHSVFGSQHGAKLKIEYALAELGS